MFVLPMQTITNFNQEGAGSIQNTDGNPLHVSFGLLLTGKQAPVVEEKGIQPEMSETEKRVEELIQFLRIDDIASLEKGSELMEDMHFFGGEFPLTTHPLITGLVTEEEAVSIEELFETHSLYANRDNEGLFLPNSLYGWVEEIKQSLESGNHTVLANQETQKILRFAKVIVLLQNEMKSSEDQSLTRWGKLLSAIAELAENTMNDTDKKNRGTGMLLDRFQGLSVTSFSNKQMDSAGKQEGARVPVDYTGTNPFLPMSKIEQLVLRMPDKPITSGSDLSKELETMLAKAKFSTGNGVQKLLVRLNPEHLGALRIELIQKDGMISAKIIASTTIAKEMLEANAKGLKEVFVSHSLPLEKLEISQSSANASQLRNFQRESEQHHHHSSSRDTQAEEEDETFLDRLEEAREETEVQI
ncbi:MAG: flagellar hook-length control protein FliK [Bacillus sp. (in: firmicutes)]